MLAPPQTFWIHPSYITKIENLSEIHIAATSLASQWFRMDDRGVIEVGKNADLVLIRGNPVDDIRVTREVERVWIAGKEVSLEG